MPKTSRAHKLTGALAKLRKQVQSTATGFNVQRIHERGVVMRVVSTMPTPKDVKNPDNATIGKDTIGKFMAARKQVEDQMAKGSIVTEEDQRQSKSLMLKVSNGFEKDLSAAMTIFVREVVSHADIRQRHSETASGYTSTEDVQKHLERDVENLIEFVDPKRVRLNSLAKYACNTYPKVRQAFDTMMHLSRNWARCAVKAKKTLARLGQIKVVPV